MTRELRPRSASELLQELEPLLSVELDRHNEQAVEWFPHEYVPYERGRNFVDEPWTPSDSGLPDIASIAMEVNLLTEDNLPYYTLALTRTFGHTEAWDAWVRRWTAEEGRHSIVLRDYLTVTRGIDPTRLEVQRMDMVQRGWYPDFATELTPLDGLVYTTLQELATRIAHRNTGTVSADAEALRILQRIAADENLHYLFYRSMGEGALALWPSQMMHAIERQVVGFSMPGADMPAFADRAKRMAQAGVYNFRIHHDQILSRVLLQHWKIDRVDGLTDEAKEARDRTLAFMRKLDRVASRLDERAVPVAADVLRSASA
ncbi:MAG TPA: acyl-ACP desaturase [Actinomycetota bacterium]|nr:acyl-ACP desaturase [Actinomycetota bacterium]